MFINYPFPNKMQGDITMNQYVNSMAHETLYTCSKHETWRWQQGRQKIGGRRWNPSWPQQNRSKYQRRSILILASCSIYISLVDPVL